MDVEALFEAFRDVPKPETVQGCSQGCCMEDDEVEALFRIDRLALTRGPLLMYVQHAFVTLSHAAEFVYLLPGIMKVWAEELYRDDTDYTGYVHTALQRSGLLSGGLSPPRRDVLAAFMREAVLGRIGVERSLAIDGPSPTHKWPRLFASYGALLPDAGELWQRWWSFSSPGHAIAAAQYASCLAFRFGDNPIFTASRPGRGGGPPSLWEYDAFIDDDWRWLPANQAFLKDVLTTGYFGPRLEAAARVLAAEHRPQVQVVAEALRADASRFEKNAQRLLRMLATPNSMVRIETLRELFE